ncbi:unnamed protein product [Arabidopsis halleri]
MVSPREVLENARPSKAERSHTTTTLGKPAPPPETPGRRRSKVDLQVRTCSAAREASR